MLLGKGSSWAKSGSWTCMNGARSGGWFIQSQWIGTRTCKVTSNVLHQDYDTS